MLFAPVRKPFGGAVRTKLRVMLVGSVFCLCLVNWIEAQRRTGSDVTVSVVLPQTLEAFIDSSDVIVDATVQSVFPPTEVQPLAFVTDSVFRVNEVLKGSERSKEIVISQYGGVSGDFQQHPSQFDVVKSGERYFLFLTKPSPERLRELTERPGLVRYDTMTYAGIVRVTPTGVRMNRDLEALKNYNETSALSFASQIANYVAQKK